MTSKPYSIKKVIEKEMAKHQDKWGNIIHGCIQIKLSEVEPDHDWYWDDNTDVIGVDLIGKDRDKAWTKLMVNVTQNFPYYFTVWTLKRVYFPCKHDNGYEWCASVPRDPCHEVTKHMG